MIKTVKSWRKTVIKKDATIKQACEILDASALRIVLVVDENEKLLGVVTDGDVRRALLKHFSFEIPVSEIMNAQPKTAKNFWSRHDLLTLFHQHQLLQAPLVDEENKVIGLINLQDLSRKQKYDNPIFLMAGGFGTRLRPLTNNCPKPMLKVGDRPILERILMHFVEAGFYRFYISTHYLPDKIQDYFQDGKQWGINIHYVHEEQPLGTGGALGLLPHDELDQPIFLMNGDLLTTLDLLEFLEFHQSQSGIATMCVRSYDHQIPYGVVTAEGAQVRTIVEKPVLNFFINAGIYLLEPAVVKSVAPGTYIDMPTLLEREVAGGSIVNIFPIHEYWLDIGRVDDYKAANEDFYKLGL